MNYLYLFQYLLRCLLIIFSIYHIFKKEYKKVWAALLVFVLSFLTGWLDIFFNLKIDTLSTIGYCILIFMALYLGSSIGYYDRFSWWDRSIHFLSGAAFVGFGIAIAGISAEMVKWKLLLFGFTFSVTVHAFWEIIEYLVDCLTHSNAQRWQKNHASVNHQPRKAIQPPGLVDTMNDSICCMIGAILSVIIWLVVI